MNKLKLKGIGLAILGVITVVWWVIKVIASLITAIIISNMYHLNGYSWYAVVIVIFSIICKLLFYNNSLDYYRGLIDDYKLEVENNL